MRADPDLVAARDDQQAGGGIALVERADQRVAGAGKGDQPAQDAIQAAMSSASRRASAGSLPGSLRRHSGDPAM